MMYLKKLLQAKKWLSGSIRHLPLLPIGSRSNVGATGGDRHGQRTIACSGEPITKGHKQRALSCVTAPDATCPSSHLVTHRHLNRNDPHGIEHGQPLSSFNT